MSDDKQVSYGVCILITGEGRAPDGSLGIIGVARRNDPNSFGLIGGKVDPGEDEITAAIRECREETGIEAWNLKEVYRRTIDETTTHDIATFSCEYKGEPAKQEGEPECRWCTVDELLAGRFGNYNRQVFLRAGILKA